MSKSHILITGGCGLIGSATIKSLNDKGYTNITVVDRLGKTDKWKNLVGLKFSRYIEYDDFVSLLSNLSRPESPKIWDTIIHLGANSRTTELDVAQLYRTNYQFSIDLLHYSLNMGVRFVYASSAATYGLGENGMSDSADLSTLRPLNAYGYFKHLFDQYVENQGWNDKVVGLKLFNIFGPGENHKADMRSVISKGFEEIRNDGRMTLFEMPDRPIGRDFLYVKDAADITTWFAVGDGRAANGLFNIGSGVATSWNELAGYLFAALDLKPDIRYIPIPDHLKGKYQYWTKADISRLRAAGYDKTLTPIGAAIKDYVTNYLVPDRRIGT